MQASARVRVVVVAVLVSSCSASGSSGGANSGSRTQRNGRHALLVDGAPYLVLGAQVNNSSAWPAMLPKVWPAVGAAGEHGERADRLGTDRTHPDRFDFCFLDTLLAQAREHEVRLILLWFATWKNNGPNYAPEWVKLDNKRFLRVVTATASCSIHCRRTARRPWPPSKAFTR